MRLRSLLCLAFVLLPLCGCGNKGELVPPEPPPQDEAVARQ